MNRAVATAAPATTLLVPRNTAGAPAASSADQLPAEVDVPATQTLRALAERAGLRVGTAVDAAALAADATYREHLSREFSSVTAENVMKWAAIEPERGVYDWVAADTLVDFARRHRQAVRGHTLVWHNQNPTWLTEGDFSPPELRQILRQHIHDEVGHFKGRIWHWDVVNEVLDDDGQPRDNIWLRVLGPGYIADAFRWAHQADPAARLYLNDYNIEGINPKSDACYELVRRLRRDGVPVHGVGMQGHLGVQYGFPGDVLQNLHRFEQLGVETAFTEVDVRVPMPTDATKLQAQAQGYSMLLQACLLARGCVSYTVWGFTDRRSWVPAWFARQGAGTLLDENFGPKPAHQAVRTSLLLAPGVSRGRG